MSVQTTYGDCITLTYIFSFVLAYPLGALVDHFHPLRMVIFTQMLLAMVYLWGGLFTHDVFTFGVTLVATGILSGCWLTANASLNQRLLPKAEFAQFASATGMVVALLTALCGPAVGLFLDHVVNHDYRYIYYISFCAGVAALICNFFLHRQFMKLGGPKNYVAPEFAVGKSSL
jgi:MFS family permease